MTTPHPAGPVTHIVTGAPDARTAPTARTNARSQAEALEVADAMLTAGHRYVRISLTSERTQERRIGH
jgi:hypothetical protein